MKLDADRYEALRARDPRFDGQFFVCVQSTGIYCRPVCPARTPRASVCVFTNTAAAAERAGFRPCLRCRPELAPAATVVSLEEALFAAIRQRAIHGDSVDQLAACAGYSSRQLRRLMVRAFGVTPVEIAQTERLLFAKKLLQETALPASQIAFSAGFGSLRRFNALFRARYALSPTALRRQRSDFESRAAHGSGAFRLRLAYRPPLAWPELLAYLVRRATPGVEEVRPEGTYSRTVSVKGETGRITVQRSSEGAWLDVILPAHLAGASWEILTRLRALFDLDANPAVIDARLRLDPLLSLSVRKHPGLRVPGAWDPFELAVRAVLGQQVSVAGATTLAGRLAARFGKPLSTTHPQLRLLFPTAEQLAALPAEELATVGLPRARGETLRELARAAIAGALSFAPGVSLQDAVSRLRQIRGIGEWTAQYVAMRGLRYPDAFPAGDLGVRKAFAGPGKPLPSEKETLARADAFRPWRAYATLHLWQSFADAQP